TPGTGVNGAGRWWIQTWNPVGNGAWSAPLSFTAPALLPPPAATLVSPSGAIGTTNPTYTWNAVSAATWYYLLVNDGVAAPKITQWFTAAGAGCGAGTGTCSATPSTSVTGAGQWWIRTWNPAGDGPLSAPLSFTAPTGFNSQFNGSAEGWFSNAGAWF